MIDWEGTSAFLRVQDASVVLVQLNDTTAGGARFAVFFNNTNTSSAMADPNGYADASPNLRIATLVSAPAQSTHVLAAGPGIGGESFTLTLTLLTEPAFVGDHAADQSLAVVGFLTDGTVVPLPPAPARRIEFLGDSLTAGYGSGFDQPGATPCGAGSLINDVTNTYGALLCGSFGALCQWEAVSGVTIETGQPNLPQYWANWTLGSMLQQGWPAAERQAWDFRRFVPHAVVVNLGENDWKPGSGSDPAFVAAFVDAYVAFGQRIAAQYAAAAPGPTIFATIAPHEKGQSAGIVPAVARLRALGIDAHFLNATVPGAPPGCGGHPGPSIHRAAYLAARPVIAAAMGW